MDDYDTMYSIPEQKRFWNDWNTTARERAPLDRASRRRGEVVLALLDSLELAHPRVLEVGCGTGWLSEQLSRSGQVTAVDLADEVIERARERIPQVRFLSGDIMTLPLEEGVFDVVVTLETLSHVENQRDFIARLAGLLGPGGHLILTTQNKFVFARCGDVVPQRHGQLRHWLSIRDVKRLLRPSFGIVHVTTLMPDGHRGVLRLVNSYRLANLARRIVSERWVERLKERIGLGQTIAVLAKKASMDRAR